MIPSSGPEEIVQDYPVISIKPVFAKKAKIRIELELDIHPLMPISELVTAVKEEMVGYVYMPGYDYIRLIDKGGVKTVTRDSEVDIEVLTVNVVGFRSPDKKEAIKVGRSIGCSV